AAKYLIDVRGIDPGIEPWPADLRFHPQCPFKGQMHPAMIALFRDIHTGQPCGIHRTALKPDGSGKAFDDAKAMLGRSRDAAIMLDAFDTVELGIAVCEGIESALSARYSPKLWLRPMWACGSVGAIRKFPVLPGVETISVFADGDATGRGAARALCQRYEIAGLDFDLYEPESDKADANTILRGAA
ncbi:MAG: toprim domain-containing protein, partial [Planctomyces sp.]